MVNRVIKKFDTQLMHLSTTSTNATALPREMQNPFILSKLYCFSFILL